MGFLPIRIMPFVWTAVVAALAVGAFWWLDEFADKAKEQVRAEYRIAEADAREKAEREAEEARQARMAAMRDGAPQRLRALWCRDCP